MANWTRRLQTLREQSGVTRDELGRRAAVAAVTIKAYELGYRHPTGQLLIALLRGLDADFGTRTELLEAAGFSREGAAEGDCECDIARDALPTA
jgi:transcriptional regulator with XRE-family HTH domain